MSILTPAVIDAFDALCQRKGCLKNPITVWHCGKVNGLSSIEGHKGLWVYKSEAKSRNFANMAIAEYNDPSLPSHHPYFSVMRLGPKGLRVADFGGGSFETIMRRHYNANHDKTKQALIEWANLRGFDLVLATNCGMDEVVVVHPTKHLAFQKCQDLLSGQWILDNTASKQATDDSDPSP